MLKLIHTHIKNLLIHLYIKRNMKSRVKDHTSDGEEDEAPVEEHKHRKLTKEELE